MKWKVTVPEGQWMCGTHRFATKREATNFANDIARVNGVNVQVINEDRAKHHEKVRLA